MERTFSVTKSSLPSELHVSRLRCCCNEGDESFAQTARSLTKSPFTRIARAYELTHLGISWVVCHLQYPGSLGMFSISKLSLVPGGWS